MDRYWRLYREEELVPALALALLRLLRGVSPRLTECGTPDEWIIEHWFQSDFVDPCDVLFRLGIGEWTRGAPNGQTPENADKVGYAFFNLPDDDEVMDLLAKGPREKCPSPSEVHHKFWQFNHNFGSATPFQTPVVKGKPFHLTHPFQADVLKAFVAIGVAEKQDDGAFMWKESILPWVDSKNY